MTRMHILCTMGIWHGSVHSDLEENLPWPRLGGACLYSGVRSSQNMRDYSGHLSLLLLMHDCYCYDPGLSAHPRIAWHVFLFFCSTDQSQFLMRDFCFDFWFRPFTCDIRRVHFLLQLQKDTRSYEVLRTEYRDENGVQGCKTSEQTAFSVDK